MLCLVYNLFNAMINDDDDLFHPNPKITCRIIVKRNKCIIKECKALIQCWANEKPTGTDNMR